MRRGKGEGKKRKKGGRKGKEKEGGERKGRGEGCVMAFGGWTPLTGLLTSLACSANSRAYLRFA